MMLPGEDFVAGLHDEPVGLVGEPFLGVVYGRRGLFQNRV